ncbi:hypothetical protein RUM43_004981 [Polyplax serrata]|uniref:Uncharacterized protein n=1 Tax=Polyplax serrata TaxID=468196 RepID=A0AAN8SCE1_POLSC
MSGALQNCRKKSAAQVGERSKNKGNNSKDDKGREKRLLLLKKLTLRNNSRNPTSKQTEKQTGSPADRQTNQQASRSDNQTDDFVHPGKKEKNEAFTASVPEGMKKNAQEYVTRPDQVESSNCQQNGGQVRPHMIFV